VARSAPTGDAPVSSESEPVPGPLPPRTAAEVAGAPRPEDASGIARGPETTLAERLVWVPRTLLLVPSLAVGVVASPLRGAAWLWDRYKVAEHLAGWLFNDDLTAGVYPLIYFDTNLGFQGELRAFHDDLFGQRESIRLNLAYGGSYKQHVIFQADTGDRLPGQTLGLTAAWSRRDTDRFYGIGNADLEEDGVMPPEPLPPTPPVAVRSLFRQRVTQLELDDNIALPDHFGVIVSAAFWNRSFSGDPGQTDSTTDIYMANAIPGFDGYNTLHGQLRLYYDTRRPSSQYISETLLTTGGLATAWLDGARVSSSDADSYLLGGIELQRYFNLSNSRRTLGVRARLEDVVAGDQVPFVELPTLGGPRLLRGYNRQRFRDNTLALLSLDYQFELNHFISARLFVDTGRVFPGLSDFDLDGFRLGFGGGLETHVNDLFLFRTLVAGSEEGVFFSFVFSPVYRVDAGVGRPGRR
jgi:hypothetical protein